MSAKPCWCKTSSVGCAIFEVGIAWFWPDWRMRRLMKVEEEHVIDAVEQRPGHAAALLPLPHPGTQARCFGLVRPGSASIAPTPIRCWSTPSTTAAAPPASTWWTRMDVKGHDQRRCAAAMPSGMRRITTAAAKASVFVPTSRSSRRPPSPGTATWPGQKGAVTLPCCNIRAKGYTLHIGAPLEDYPSGDDLADASRANRGSAAVIRPGSTCGCTAASRPVSPEDPSYLMEAFTAASRLDDPEGFLQEHLPSP